MRRAYAGLASLGFRYLATHQDVDTTRRRVTNGDCYIVLDGERVVGTILVMPPSRRAPYCEWYDRSDVAVLSQFGVEPSLQGQGIGSRLLAFGEERARVLGAKHVAVDTAEGATHLVTFYNSRGYQFVGYAQWEHTNYRSVILSKALEADAQNPRPTNAVW
ncbi:MAG TPA: GNAT family N-acetyltransferase [Polyangiaceae bacterium]